MSITVSSAELLSLTQGMLKAADAGDWEEVERIEAKRRNVLKIFEGMIRAVDSEPSREMIACHLQEVLSLNMRIIDLGQHVKKELTTTMRGLHRSREAVNAYYGIK